MVATRLGEEDQRNLMRAGTVPGRSVVTLDGRLGVLQREERPLRRHAPFSRVPETLLARPLQEWKEMMRGRWERPDHITLGEGRACLKLHELCAVEPTAHRSRLFSLMDNMSWGCACAKGRSCSPSLNYLLRRRCATTQAAGIQLGLPWVDTARMPADGASRDKELPAPDGPRP